LGSVGREAARQTKALATVFAVCPELVRYGRRPKSELLEVKRLRSDALIDWSGSGVRQNGLEGEFGGGSNSLRTGPPPLPPLFFKRFSSDLCQSLCPIVYTMLFHVFVVSCRRD